MPPIKYIVNNPEYDQYGDLYSYELICDNVIVRVHMNKTLSIVSGNVYDLAYYLFNGAINFPAGIHYFKSMIFVCTNNGTITWYGAKEPVFLEELQKAFSKICSMKVFL